jgi:CHAD domain-containing protein
MAYRLDLVTDVPSAVRAVALERFDHAIAAVRDDGDVHEARKDLKKLRSLLRLCRDGMPAGERRAINATLRDIGARLAGAREADVAVATLRSLQADPALERRFARTSPGIDPDVVAALAGQRAAVPAWPVDRVDRRALATGAGIAYARGRRRFRSGEAGVHELHEWRKRVKDLWYHARLLQDAWPPVLSDLADDAHALSELLGDDHDLGVLAEQVQDELELVTRCHLRRAELQDQAFALGARVYVDTPTAFARRIASRLAA